MDKRVLVGQQPDCGCVRAFMVYDVDDASADAIKRYARSVGEFTQDGLDMVVVSKEDYNRLPRGICPRCAS